MMIGIRRRRAIRESGNQPPAPAGERRPAGGTGEAARATAPARSWAATWAGYAACAWALVFAAISFYWAAGGTAGGDTIGPALAKLALARDPGFVAILWGTGALKALGGLFALALVRPWGRRLPRRALLTAAWGAGALLLLYAGAGLIEHGLMAGGIIGIPAGLGATALRWHLALWDPWWLIGGILFCAAARSYGQTRRA